MILKCLLIKIIEFLFYDILKSGRSNIQMLIRSSNQTGTGVTFETRVCQYKPVKHLQLMYFFFFKQDQRSKAFYLVGYEKREHSLGI